MLEVRNVSPAIQSMAGVRIQVNEFIPEFNDKLKYRLPDKDLVEREKIRINNRFISYGPEDLDWLLYSGLVKVEKERVYFIGDMKGNLVNSAPLEGMRNA